MAFILQGWESRHQVVEFVCSHLAVPIDVPVVTRPAVVSEVTFRQIRSAQIEIVLKGYLRRDWHVVLIQACSE